MYCIKQRLWMNQKVMENFRRRFPYRLRDFSLWPFHSGRLRLSRFGPGIFQSSRSFRSRDISVRLWNLAEILCVHFLMQTYLNQIKVLFKKTTKMIQDPTVNQHVHDIFVVISKQFKSLSKFSLKYKFFSLLIKIHI